MGVSSTTQRMDPRSARDPRGRHAGLAGLVSLALLLPIGGQPLSADGPGQSGQDAARRGRNRLAGETSPYLLLHAHNPVDWYPWGPEAFARAKAEGKPIFLSIGYSSCYWCHVMERESFMDEGIARTLNEKFICIKVDREERPDVDQIYMTALQAFGQGGWPMSMFLTPDGRPFYGGTYFPPKERDGITGFPTVIEGVATAWRDERPEVEKAADQLAEMVKRASAGGVLQRRARLDRAMAAGGVARLADQFDPEYGGFGFDPEHPRRPKFPEPVNLVFLLDQYRRDQEAGDRPRAKAPPTLDPAATKPVPPLEMVATSLDRMARGGIRDHLAGGYHRYATSRFWIVPHFEKMLYDNAQLASAHLLAFELTGDPRWRREAEDTFAFVARSMTAPEGGFYSALDAETEGEEGAYYVWGREEVRKVLGDRYESFAQVYGLMRDPNFEGDRYVLLEPRTRSEQATTLKTTPEDLEATLAPARASLLAVRDKRPAPLRDDKILTSWNGLMVAAYADGFRVLEEPAYRKAAETAADFLWSKLRTDEGRLLRTHRAGQSKLPAYLEDYAFLAHGLIRLHAATGDETRLDQAKALTDRMIDDFADPKDGGFFYTADDHESLLARPKDPYDNALPSANAVAIRNLVALAEATGEARYLDQAGRALEAFSATLATTPTAVPTMLLALEEYLDARESAEPLEAGPAEPLVPPRVAAASAALGRPGAVTPGDEVAVVLTLTIEPGWHAYANKPGSPVAIPTVVSLAPDAPAALGPVRYPAGALKALIPDDPERVALYEGKVEIPATLKLKGDLPAGKATVTFRVRYQACNDRLCLPPATLAVPLSLEIKPR